MPYRSVVVAWSYSTTGQCGPAGGKIYQAPAGKRIKAVSGKQEWKNVVNYVDTDHEIDTFNDAELGLIHVSGDSRGDDVTKVVFSNIEHFVLVELENE